MTPQELIEKQIITTRFYKAGSDTFISMAGVAFQEDDGTKLALFNPNDENVSMLVSSVNTGEFTMFTYHCFVGMFASRFCKCLDKPWEAYRLHMNASLSGDEADAEYGELICEQAKGPMIFKFYLEHLGPPILPAAAFEQAIYEETLEQMIEKCPVKLTPRREFYRIGLEFPPHPGLLPVEDGVLAPYVTLPKEPKKEYVI